MDPSASEARDQGLARSLHARQALPLETLQACLEEVRRRRATDPAASLAGLLRERGLVSADLLTQSGVITGAGGPPTRADGPPEWIGNYEVERELARGGMGVVYVARNPQLDRRVALKVMQEATPDLVERFKLEARATARLRHPNIVAVHDVGQDGARHYLVMDLIEGESLKARLDREGTLAEADAVRLTAKLAHAVFYAHTHSILHRDLKPANVLVTPEGEPLITDFGLAKVEQADPAQGLTVSGQVVGTPGYMPPEQAGGELDQIDRRSDVYSLGATLYALLVGRPPFEGATMVNILNKVLSREPTPPRALVKSLSKDIDTICVKCLEKDPLRRYQSARELAEDLERVQRGEPVLARPVSLPRRVRFWVRRHKTATAVALTLSLAVGAAIGWIGWVGPALAAQAERDRLVALEAEAERAVAAEVERLNGADADVVLAEARQERILARVREALGVAPGSPEDELVVRAASRLREPIGRLLSKAHFEQGSHTRAYRHDPEGPWGVKAQLELAKRYAEQLQLDRAIRLLRRAYARHPEAARGALPLLGRSLALQGKLGLAAAAFGEAGTNSDLARLVHSLAEVRQTLVIQGNDRPVNFKSREPMIVLRQPRPILLLPWRTGRPAYRIEGGKLVPAPASPLASLERTDVVYQVVPVDLDGDGKQELVVALTRPGAGHGLAVLVRSGESWRVARSSFAAPWVPVGLAVGDLDGDQKPEAVLAFGGSSGVLWVVGLTQGDPGRMAARRVPLPAGSRMVHAPVVADLDRDGRDDLFLMTDALFGGRAEVYRLAGERLQRRAAVAVGHPGMALSLGDGRVAAVVDVNAIYLGHRSHSSRPTGAAAENALVVLRWEGGRQGLHVESRLPISQGDALTTEIGVLARGRLLEKPALVFFADRKRRTARRRAIGQRVLATLGAGAPLAFNVSHMGLRSLCIQDLDGDGHSELLSLHAGRLLVLGRPTRPLPALAGAAEANTARSAAGLLLQAAEDLLEFEAFEEAEEVLQELLARFPASIEAVTAQRLQIEAILQGARKLLTLADQLVRERKLEEAEQQRGQANALLTQAKAKAINAGRRSGVERELRRRFFAQAAEACRLQLDWSGLLRNTMRARRAANRSGDQSVLSLRGLSNMTSVFSGIPGAAGQPLVATLPARVQRADRGLELQVDGHSRHQVIGVPLRYHGGAIEFEMDFELESSAWASHLTLGLLPGEPTSRHFLRPGALVTYLSGITRWDRQGLAVWDPECMVLRSYRGRWRLKYGHYPEVRLRRVELWDRARKALVYRRVSESPRALGRGRVVFGAGVHDLGHFDSLLAHGYHPTSTRLRIERWSLRTAGRCKIDRRPPLTGAALDLLAGEHFLRGEQDKAGALWRRLVEQDATAHAARVHLALCGPRHARAAEAAYAGGLRGDPYGFLLALDDALRGAPARHVRAAGAVIRRLAARFPGPCGALLGEWSAVREHLQGDDPATRYLRLRIPLTRRREDMEWFRNRHLRGPGNELPFLVWAPGSKETTASLRAGLRRARQALRSRNTAAVLRAWVAASRLLIVEPNDREALLLRAQVVGFMVRVGRGNMERDCWRLIRLHPKDYTPWFLLARFYTQRRATGDTLMFLRQALGRGMPRQHLALPHFNYLRKDRRFAELK